MKRRTFLHKSGIAAAALGLPTLSAVGASPRKIGPNDKIRLATIGYGIQGHYDTRSALATGQAELVAVADLYKDRLTRAKEMHGKDLFTTRDYREILDRKDIDAVIIATADHWHDAITIDALKAGKHVYCEKPMVQQINEGLPVIEAWKAAGTTMQVGSQRISGTVFREAKRQIAEGAIGEINYIESNNDRFSAIGAWNYTIPEGTSAKDVNWDTFLKDSPEHSYDPKRFFRWRNYKDYGTGVAGDLFVHLITGVHYAIDSLGPNRIYASGHLSYWKDGRDVPDVMAAIFDYPKTDAHSEFQMVLRVNFANAGNINNFTRIIGTEGQLDIGWNRLTLSQKQLPKAPGFGGYDSVFTLSEKEQNKAQKAYDNLYSEADRKAPEPKEVVFQEPEGEDQHVNHFDDFFSNAREGNQGTVEDPVFGFRAAAPVLACNDSYFQKKVIHWDPEAMKVAE
ncbi:MAG: Gfo/Idh/MocA family oxidoreductase [Bacteroidota bacterium]